MNHFSTFTRPISFNDLRSIGCAEELFALARAVEREGVRRYTHLSEQMETLGRPQLATLFRMLRDQEMEHESSLDGLAQRGGLGHLPDLRFSWDVLHEGMMPDQLETLTPALALRYALHNEQRTYALFLRIAAGTHIAEIRHHAELLAAEELEHVGLLARHDVAESPALPLAAMMKPERLDDLLSLAAAEARTSAARRIALARRLRSIDDQTSAQLMQDLAEEAEARSRDLGNQDSIPRLTMPGVANDNFSPLDILRGEAQTSFATFHGFTRIANALPPCGLSGLAQHEANLRLAATARLTDRAAAIRGERVRRKRSGR